MATTKKLQTKTVSVNFGPQHPSMHGVLFVRVELDGELVVHVEPHIGYLHRSMEKIFENSYYNQCIAISDRADYLGGYFNETVIALAAERLMEIEVPPRAEYLRVILMELTRIANHIFYWGNYGQDLGSFWTTALWAWREREMYYDIVEEISGYRQHPNYIRIGGVYKDTTDGWLQKVLDFCDEMEKRLKIYENLVTYNEIFLARSKNVGKITKKWAIDWGITGPLLRCAGVKWDLRKDDPYSVYDQFEFDIPTTRNGDCWDAYRVRMDEITESIKIVRQAVSKIPAGPIRCKLPMLVEPPKGDTYARIEGPRGELGCYLVSDGSKKPYRLKLRAPAFVNLASITEFLKDQLIGDFIALLAIYDPVMGEVDR